MRKATIPYVLNVFLFILTLFLSLMTDWNPPKWKEFNDPGDYLQQSRIPLTSLEFYAPHQQGTFFPRPFTVPLFYKLAGSKPETIIQMQRVIHSLATLFLAFALLLIINRLWVQILMVFSIYVLMSWWNIIGWTAQLLSESLSVSLLLCWIASFLFIIEKKRWYFVLLHMLITILFSFTRDTWPYILLLFYFLIAGYTVFTKNLFFAKSMLLLCFSVILLFVQLMTANAGHRHRLPLMNTMAVRILPNPDYTAWFEVRGVPDVKKLHSVYRTIDINSDADRHKIWNLYWNKDYSAFNDWTLLKGRREYMNFMISHPSYFFLFHENKQQLKRIFATNLWYTPSLRGYSRLTEPVFPLFGPVSVTIFCVLLIFLYFRKKDPMLLFPVLLWLIFFANVFLTYNADALEVERHLFITMIGIQLVGIMAVGLIVDQVNTQSPSPS
jgi:hypothetical protein